MYFVRISYSYLPNFGFLCIAVDFIIFSSGLSITVYILCSSLVFNVIIVIFTLTLPLSCLGSFCPFLLILPRKKSVEEKLHIKSVRLAGTQISKGTTHLVNWDIFHFLPKESLFIHEYPIAPKNLALH